MPGSVLANVTELKGGSGSGMVSATASCMTKGVERIAIVRIGSAGAENEVDESAAMEIIWDVSGGMRWTMQSGCKDTSDEKVWKQTRKSPWSRVC
jgi:hypothetical protein